MGQELAEGDEYLRSIWVRVRPRVALAMKTIGIFRCASPALLTAAPAQLEQHPGVARNAEFALRNEEHAAKRGMQTEG